MFDPQKFFIGMMDFFSILLPGAVLTYLFSDVAGAPIFKDDPIPGGTEGWIVFIFSSYLLGHLVFLLGSLLDDLLYDKVRNGTYEGQVRRLAAGEERPAWLSRWVAGKVMKNRYDATLRRAIDIRNAYVADPEGPDVINAFQWCKVHLALNHRDAVPVVERFEADSKFFRSFIVVMLIAFFWMLFARQWVDALGFALLLPFATWRYLDQRTKAVNQAYYFVIAEHAAKGTPLSAAPVFTHAGAVAYRGDARSGYQYALVESSRRRDDWVLPKGHVKRGETLAQTAVRELHEETGIWGKVEKPLGDAAYERNGVMVQAQFFLVQPTEVEDASPEGRRVQWLTLDDAFAHSNYEEVRIMLERAHQHLTSGQERSSARAFTASSTTRIS
jgi:8-oxo-dGTP pyrophosphatase MutT (NUDIX family)